MNTIASRDQFKPIRIGENLVVNYKLGYLSADIICSEKRTVSRDQMEAIVFIILQIFFASRAVLKSGEYINNSRHLARKYARIFVRGNYMFREANSFPRAKFEENCELRGTDNVQGQSEHIFAPSGGFCLYYPSYLFLNARNF